MDILGDSNTMELTKTGYGASSSDAGYFYLDLNGSTNTIEVQQTSTLALDWLKIESDASNSNICVIQSDGGTSTSLLISEALQNYAGKVLSFVMTPFLPL